MPVRRRIEAVQENRVHFFCFLLSDGTCGLPGWGAFPDRTTARRAWPSYRRETWEHTFVGHVPHAATEFDGVTTHGHDLLWSTWQSARFDLGPVLEAFEADRQAVATFRKNDARGAKSIADFLDEFLHRLKLMETEARRIGASTAEPWQRGTPEISWARRYGDRIEEQSTQVH